MSRVKFILGFATVGALAVAGCSRGGNQQPPQNAYSYQQSQQSYQTSMSSEQTKTCPMAVPGAEVSMNETGNGIALTFTTDSGDVNELRRRVYKVADQYREQATKLNKQSKSGQQGGQQGMGGQEGMGGQQGTGGQQGSQSGDEGWDNGGAGGQSGFGPQGPENGPGTTTPGETNRQSGTGGNAQGGDQSGTVNNAQMGTSGGANSSGSDSTYGQGLPNPNNQETSQQGIGQQQANAGSSSSVTVPFNVLAQDIDRGARLLFTPRDPSQIDVLRSEIRQQASLMQPGQCPSPPISLR